jgi:large conductance mechanosensitive channel
MPLVSLFGILYDMKGLQGFREFIKNQGVFGLAVGFILGGAVSKFVSSLVTDIIYPVLNGLLGGVGDLTTQVVYVGGSAVKYGTFLSTGIDFIIIAFVVYASFKLLKIDHDIIKK